MFRTYRSQWLNGIFSSFHRTASIQPVAGSVEVLKTSLPQVTCCLRSRNTNLAVSKRSIHLASALQKYNKKSTLDEETDSEAEDSTEFKDERDSKVLKTKVNSLRADLLVKAGLGVARNKVENAFYESRIRVNGHKLQKKSVQLNVGDEIDVIKGFSQANPSHLVVSRVVILSASEREEGLSVHLRRYKTLLIENYSGANAYKSSETHL